METTATRIKIFDPEKFNAILKQVSVDELKAGIEHYKRSPIFIGTVHFAFQDGTHKTVSGSFASFDYADDYGFSFKADIPKPTKPTPKAKRNKKAQK